LTAIFPVSFLFSSTYSDLLAHLPHSVRKTGAYNDSQQL
jgi:hypothetical protein